MTPTEQDEEQLEQAINSLFMVGYDIGRTAKIILSAEDLRSHLENNAIADRQKVDMAANPHKDKLLHIISADRKRVELEARIDELSHIKNPARTSKQKYLGLDYVVEDRLAELKAQQENK